MNVTDQEAVTRPIERFESFDIWLEEYLGGQADHSGCAINDLDLKGLGAGGKRKHFDIVQFGIFTGLNLSIFDLCSAATQYMN